MRQKKSTTKEENVVGKCVKFRQGSICVCVGWYCPRTVANVCCV